ncbi:unnamed protein product [Rotaria sordida]|uniref:Uncharacterized protein n=1 Tax=Rotaria sordida TaxID=392033 RepID=A0A818VMS6_9BILA|nr:unnamed protein product [Rotaria sordida]
MYEVEEIEEHFAPISGVDTGSISEKSDFDDDSCNKRKHLDGGGKKLTYVGLDSRLFAWYREKRTDPASTTNASDAGEERRRDILNSCQA